MANATLSERMHLLVEQVTNEYRRFKELEVVTGVQADSWKSWFHGRQRPTAEMIEVVCKAWPEYAFWLATGGTDTRHGHITPEAQSWPEEERNVRGGAKSYFRKVVDMAKLNRGELDAATLKQHQAELRKLGWTRKAEEESLDVADEYDWAQKQTPPDVPEEFHRHLASQPHPQEPDE
jgi:hypothetical protein